MLHHGTYEIMMQCNCDFVVKSSPMKTIYSILPSGKHPIDHILRKLSRTFINHMRCCYGFSVSPLVSCGRILIPQICKVRGWSFMGKCLGQRWIPVIGLVSCCGSQWAILKLDPCGKAGFVAKWGSSCVLFLSRAPVCPSAFYHGVTQNEFITRNQVDVMILGFSNLPYG